MPRKFIKRFLPSHETVRNHKGLRCFGRLLHDPNLWHLNRRSAPGAFAIGLFCAFIPLPFQMLMAAGAAIVARVNLPISVALVWLTNPITIPPIFYVCYLLGNWLIGTPAQLLEFHMSMAWVEQEISNIWKPLLLGSLIIGTLSAATGYLLIRWLWYRRLFSRIERREAKKAAKVPVNADVKKKN